MDLQVQFFFHFPSSCSLPSAELHVPKPVPRLAMWQTQIFKFRALICSLFLAVQVSSIQENFLRIQKLFPRNSSIQINFTLTFSLQFMPCKIMQVANLYIRISGRISYREGDGASKIQIHVLARCDVIARCLRMPKFSTSVHVGHLWRKVDVGPSPQQIAFFQPHAAESVKNKGQIVSRNRRKV